MYPPDPGLVTYESAASWLPLDVRETIEVSIPCSPAMEGGHMWSQEVVYSWAGPQRTWWQCACCGITARTDPRPLTSFARLMEKGL